MGSVPENFDWSAFLSTPMSRRHLLMRGAALAAIPTLGGALLSACGSTAPSPASSASASPSAVTNPVGTAVFLNFPGWIGASEVANFHKQFPAATLRLNTNYPSTIAGSVQLIKNSPGAYDLVLGDPSYLGQAKAAGIYQAPDWSAIPNISNVDERYRRAFPDGAPNDFGIGIIGYRKDLVTEPITSWADFWRLAPKYKGKITVEDLDRATIGMALKYLGFSANSTDQTQITQAKDALIKLKPYLQAITAVNVSTGLAKGTIAMAHCYNYDVAVALQDNKNVVMVVPEEGALGYVEGLVPVKGSKHLDVANAFLNFHLQPQIYSDFVNTTGSSWVMSAADPFIKPAFRTSPALKPTSAELDKVEWTQYLGSATTLWNQAWEQFKAA